MAEWGEKQSESREIKVVIQMPQASSRVIKKKKFEKSINKPLIKNYIFNISRPFQLTFLTGFGCLPKAGST